MVNDGRSVGLHAVPPTQLPVGSPTLDVGLVVAGTVVLTGLPLLIGMLKQASWKAVSPLGTSGVGAF